jgi:hypothetical protein
VPNRAVRCTAASEAPPIHIGKSACTGRGAIEAPRSVTKRPSKSTLSSVHSRRITVSPSSVRRPRVLVSIPSASHSGPRGLPIPNPGSSRPSDSTSIVAHCLASSTGSRSASDTTFMPNFSRRVRPASAAIAVMHSRIGALLISRSVCQTESIPPASHRSTQRQ